MKEYRDAFEKLKSALNDALEDGHIDQKFAEMVIEKPGSVEEMIKLTRELNMLTHGKGYEKQQERHVNHVNQRLTSSDCERTQEFL